MNVLVTGATGFVGSHLCRELIDRGYNVFAISYSGRTRKVESLLGYTTFHLQTEDLRDTDKVRGLFRELKIEGVFHLAARLPEGNDLQNPQTLFDTNARATLNMLNAAHLGGVKKVVYASSMSVYSEPPGYLPVDEEHPVQPTTLSGMSKLVGELCCRLYAGLMNVVILRYAGVYGPGQRESDAIPTFIQQALGGKPITIHGDGTQTSDYTYVDDVVQATILAMEKGDSSVYNIGSGEETSVNKLAEQIIRYANPKTVCELSGDVSERPFRFVLNIGKARKALGYSPCSLAEGLQKYLKEFRIEV